MSKHLLIELYREKTTAIACLQTATDSCSSGTTEATSIFSIISTIESLCSKCEASGRVINAVNAHISVESCAISRREKCTHSIATYLERWWTDGAELAQNGMCG